MQIQSSNQTTIQTCYLAGGCLWGVEEFLRHLPGVISTEAGRANGSCDNTSGPYDGYAECVKLEFDTTEVDVTQLMGYLFEIIDPYSLNKQGEDIGPKYRSGFYSEDKNHLAAARAFINARADKAKIQLEVLPLSNYVRSDEEHQMRLARQPNDYCHIPLALLHKYKRQSSQQD